MRTIVVLAVVLAACGKKASEEAGSGSTPAREPAGAPKAEAKKDVPVAKVLDELWAKQGDLVLTTLVVAVSPDGIMRSGAGVVAASFGKRGTARPDGECTKECPGYRWSVDAGWETEPACCYFAHDEELARPRCTMPQVWKRAIDKGTPADAGPFMHLRPKNQNRNQNWFLDSVQVEFDDDC